ncbi:hypothetical protein QCA50_016188 [Cerrena zonata]|uniref:Uncharacterized protein n=1 Tax=Cerrena zonata TaxID=2478898 RepID=A0AAW0FII9_9APHY
MTYAHADTLRLLVKRYVPSGTSGPELCIISAFESQVMGIVTVVESMGFTLRRDTLSTRTLENQVHIEI